MINISICDDDKSVHEKLREFLTKYEEETGLTIHTESFSNGEALITYFPKATDILLLDIEMGTLDGLETAKKLRVLFPELCIIFITSYTKYALKSYSVKAFGFLPKPVSYAVLKNELNLALEQLRRKGAHFVLIRNRNENAVRQVDCRDILYFEVYDHDILAVMEKDRLYYRGTLNALEKELAPYGFFRCHASYLVNYRYIFSYDQTITLHNDTVLPISRTKRKEFLNNLINYVGEML